MQEAIARITAMAEEYEQRTRTFPGVIRHRLPFYLFTEKDDYHDAGGMPGSAGVFMGNKLMALVSNGSTAQTWAVVQHEGFHQFVAAKIGYGIPVWVNEGMAEYFSHAVFTGDQFATGLIPPWRLARVKTRMKAGAFKPLEEMMAMSYSEWSDDLQGANYDQAWSMVYFLAHGDDGRYERVFNNFLRDVSRKMQWRRAWDKNFGPDVSAFEQRWRAYWQGLADDPTASGRAEAVVRTVTNFYARALSQRQRFDSFDAFQQAAEAGELRSHPKQALPPSLLERALEQGAELGTWSLRKKRGWRWLVCTAADGTVYEGRFKIRSRQVQEVTVDTRPGRGR